MEAPPLSPPDTFSQKEKEQQQIPARQDGTEELPGLRSEAQSQQAALGESSSAHPAPAAEPSATCSNIVCLPPDITPPRPSLPSSARGATGE